MTRVHAYRQISAAEVCALLPNGATPHPANEAQLRPLTTVPREKAPALWLQIVKASDGRKITGQAVQKAVEAWKGRSGSEGAYPALAYWQELYLSRRTLISSWRYSPFGNSLKWNLESASYSATSLTPGARVWRRFLLFIWRQISLTTVSSAYARRVSRHRRTSKFSAEFLQEARTVHLPGFRSQATSRW